MLQQLAIYSIANDRLLADWSNRVISCNVRSNVHGYESCEATIDIPFYEAFLYYQQLGPLKLKVNWGSYRVWEGRLDDPNQFTSNEGSGLRIVAFGGWVAYNDSPYLALWSDTQYPRWLIVDNNVRPGIGEAPDRYAIDTNNRLFVTLEKGSIFGTGTAYANLYYRIPDSSSRNIVGVSFDLQTNLPTNWLIELYARQTDLSGSTNILSLACTGVTLNRSYNFTFTGKPLIDFLIYNNTGGNYTVTAETGDLFATITNLRVVTTITNRINVSFTVDRAAGSNVTATVDSTVRMYVGQRLQISGTTSESVIVLSIGSATQFNATFVNSYVIGNAVQAHVVYPDEIMKDCVTALNTLNATQVASDISLIQSQAIDLDQVIYEDIYPADIINELLVKGDTTGRQWIAQVYDDQRLIVRPRGSGRAWYADVTSLDVVRTLSELFNSVYAVYKDTNDDRKLRIVANTDAASVTKFGITRRKALSVDTTNATQATYLRDTMLALQKDPIPRATITLDRIFDSSGSPYPLHFIHSDDTLTIRNLPPILGTIYDKIRTLVVTKTDYDIVGDRITLDLELPQPQMEILLAQALKESR